jgi:hypothetical protein
MADERPSRPPAPPCRWRTSAETLDLIEAIERIEALVNVLSDRLRELTPAREHINDGEKVQS